MRLRLSQSHLSLLDRCPRKFQHVYLDQLVLPLAPEVRSHTEWGNQFHLLMQQQALGLPLHSGPGTLSPVQASVSQFIAAVPHLLMPQAGRVQESEHRRMVEMQDYLLTVVYDLLILEETPSTEGARPRAEILDWKTYTKPQTNHWLEASWQTRLYLFVLAETSAYSPEQLSMTYWFIPPHQSEQAADQPPPHVTIRYSTQQHQATHRDLTRVLTHLTQWIEDYQQGKSFPQVSPEEDLCSDCSFTLRCDRTSLRKSNGRGEGDAIDLLNVPSIEEIEEVSL